MEDIRPAPPGMMTSVPRLMVSAPMKSSGKTTVSLGLLRYFSSQGRHIISFKKGPDYIDPMWHRLASGASSANLDPYLMGEKLCRKLFIERCIRENAALSLVEGNHGLHDGMAFDGSDSSAGLASQLDLPVLLVLDGRNANRGIASQVLGAQAMPPGVRIGGVILNKVKRVCQAEKHRRAIEEYCGVPVLGILPEDTAVALPERHLGLTTVHEQQDALSIIDNAARSIEAHCDVGAIERLFESASQMEIPHMEYSAARPPSGVRIGVFRDAAFCFYYPENIEALRECGAELVFIDAVGGDGLPDVHGVYLGGGFPESFFGELSANTALMRALQQRVEEGMPVYAECGGLIYLSRSAEYNGRRYPLAGILPLDISFHERPVGHGYMELRSTLSTPWFSKGEHVRAHEFHYASAEAADTGMSCLFEVQRGHGITGVRDGMVYRNVFASFAHLHVSVTPGWAERFVGLGAAYRAGETVLAE